MQPERSSQGGLFGAVLMTPISLLYLCFLILPIGFFLALSLMKFSATELYLPEGTLENYTRLLGDAYYRKIIWDTIRIGLIVTAISMVFGFALALFLARASGAWRGVLMFLVIAPLMTGVIVRTYGWIVLLGADGLLNTALVWLGIFDKPVSMLGNQGAVIAALVHIMLPYMVFPIFSSLVAQDPHLVPAAGTLGAGPVRSFFEVTLPLAKSGIVMGSVIVFTMTAGSIVTVELLGGRDLTMMGQVIYQLILSTFNWPLAAAVAALLVITQFVLVTLYFNRTGRDK